jgi:hypothetical protein
MDYTGAAAVMEIFVKDGASAAEVNALACVAGCPGRTQSTRKPPLQASFTAELQVLSA